MMKYKIALAMTLALLIVIPFYAFAKGVKHEIKGPIQSMPAKKIGLWKINGTQVKVTVQTQIDEDECTLKKGGIAEAEGQFYRRVLIASELECENFDN